MHGAYADAALPVPATTAKEEGWEVTVDSESDDEVEWSGHPDGY